MRKVAIVGSSDTTRNMAPYDDLSWEIWTLNDMCILGLPRIDRYFELHSDSMLDRECHKIAGVKAELEWLKTNETVPVYMVDPRDWVPAAVEYPIDAIIKEFGRYFTNTVSYMIALAIYEDVDEIGLWGVDMAHYSEYGTQRPSCEYFIGLARGKGIPVHIPTESSLLSNRILYGQEDKFTAEIMRRRDNLLEEQQRQHQIGHETMLNEARLDAAVKALSDVLLWYGE